MNFSTASRDHAGHTVLSVSGEVDIHTSPMLRLALADLTGPERRLIVDLGDVQFLDSSGLGALVEGLNRAKDMDGDLSLVCPAGPMLKLLRITGLDQVFVLYATIEDAVTG
ncbi:MAG TPA: STAS domain-containing protein [Mycobacteriales bacterium]|nr:STAS domain-containing protein [Mycobacteriales bacterium]